MKNKARWLTCVAAVAAFASSQAHAAAWCELTNFTVDSYHHGGVYLHGVISGAAANWIVICGTSGTQQDCNAKATDRNLALALAAHAQGKTLLLYFESAATCSIAPYTTATSIRLNP